MTAISRRSVVVAGAVVVAAVAMAASADTLATLGQAVGWKGPLSWSLPVVIDVLGVVAMVAWFTPGTKGLGKGMTVGSVTVSIVLNAVSHLVSTGHLTVGPVLVIAVSAVPPVALALAAHLAVEATKGEAEVVMPVVTEVVMPVVIPDDQEVTAPVTAALTAVAAETDRQVVTETVTDAPARAAGEVTATDRRKARSLHTKALAETGKPVTIKALQEIGLSRRTATALRRELTAA